jgi:DNA-binding transcriptional regulator YiaG
MVTDSRRIRLIRAYLGDSSAEFAKRCGVSTVTITNWEKGRKKPGLIAGTTLAKIIKQAKLILLPSGYPVPISDVTFDE